MTDFERCQEIFSKALELAPDKVDAFLDTACDGDTELRREVRNLLAHHSPDFMEQPEHLRNIEVPERIGPYRIEKRLGAGGMGEVFLAEQLEPVRRPVALKLIKRGMDTREVVARFDSERQTLALMNHPNIAGVFDAGATPWGSPYFVMEYVPGVPITEFCDQAQLDAEARIRLFMQASDGIQHAHQKGIIHRDVKSSNVLVTVRDGVPVVKIIDFGVARATDRGPGQGTIFTDLGQIIGTPEYMSPEQADWQGQDIDTRTDVYSLGVLLYRLLVGVYPLEIRRSRKGLDEALRAIREEVPGRPSTRVQRLGPEERRICDERQATPASLSRALRGDLDWIVMKALEKDRNRRYATVSDFAGDLRRALDGEPVLARPPSNLYRLRKFVGRNRVAVIGAALVMAALVLGLAGTTVGLLRARAAEAEARDASTRASLEADRARRQAGLNDQVVEFLVDMFEVSDPGEARGSSVTAREILARGAQRVGNSLEEQPYVQGRLMETMGRVYRNLGLHVDAGPLLEAAVTRLRAAGAEPVDVARALNSLAGYHFERDELDDAKGLYEEALALVEGLPTANDDVLATIKKNLGDIYAARDELDRARQLHEEALRLREDLFGPESKEVSASISSLARLHTRAGDPAAAVPLLRRSLELREREYPAGHGRIGNGHFDLGKALLEAGQLDEAGSHLKKALAIFTPLWPEGHANVALATWALAEVEAKRGEHAAARDLYQRVVDLWEHLAASSRAAGGSVRHERAYLTLALDAQAENLREMGEIAQAAAVEARAAKLRQTP